MRENPRRYSLEEYDKLTFEEQMAEQKRISDHMHNVSIKRRLMRVYRKYMNNTIGGPHTFHSLEQAKHDQHKVGGYWVPKRAPRYPSMWNDFKLAWMVFTRQCDAFGWPEDDPVQLHDSEVYKPGSDIKATEHENVDQLCSELESKVNELDEKYAKLWDAVKPKVGETWEKKICSDGFCRVGWSLGAGVYKIKDDNFDYGGPHQLICGCLNQVKDSV